MFDTEADFHAVRMAESKPQLARLPAGVSQRQSSFRARNTRGGVITTIQPSICLVLSVNACVRELAPLPGTNAYVVLVPRAGCHKLSWCRAADLPVGFFPAC